MRLHGLSASQHNMLHVVFLSLRTEGRGEGSEGDDLHNEPALQVHVCLVCAQGVCLSVCLVCV